MSGAATSRAMAGQRETSGYEEEYRIVRPDGAVRWIRARSYPIRDGEGRISRFAGLAEDVTEQRSIEEDRARPTLVQVDLGDVVRDLDGMLRQILGWGVDLHIVTRPPGPFILTVHRFILIGLAASRSRA